MIVNLIQYNITLVHLIYSCEMLKEEALRSPALIQEVSQQVAYAPNHEVYNSVMIISMQIHHEKISINYGGFFRVDMSLLTTVHKNTKIFKIGQIHNYTFFIINFRWQPQPPRIW